MAVDGATIYRVSLLINGNTALVIGPNGEMASGVSPSVGLLSGSMAIWEPVTAGSTVANLVSAMASATDTTGIMSPGDATLQAAFAGQLMGPNGQAAGNRNTLNEVLVGIDSVHGTPGITFGPTNIVTYLTSAVSIGASSFSTNDAIPNGSTVVIESGTNTETLTTNATPTGTGPYSQGTSTTATKTHASGVAVFASVPSNRRAQVYFNTANGFLFLPSLTTINGTLYIGGNLDATLARTASHVLSQGASDVFLTGQAATGSRPAAATVGKGAQFYDTTLNKPIWSDGTNWKDAAGTTV
jgi:hypothetical protein